MAPRFVCSSCLRHTHSNTLPFAVLDRPQFLGHGECIMLFCLFVFQLVLPSETLYSTGAPRAGSTSPLTINPVAPGLCLVLRRSSPPSLAHPTPSPTSLALPTPSAVAASTQSSRRRAPPLPLSTFPSFDSFLPFCYRDTVLIPFADAKATSAVPRAALVRRTDAVPLPSFPIIEDCNAPSLTSQLLAPAFSATCVCFKRSKHLLQSANFPATESQRHRPLHCILTRSKQHEGRRCHHNNSHTGRWSKSVRASPVQPKDLRAGRARVNCNNDAGRGGERAPAPCHADVEVQAGAPQKQNICLERATARRKPSADARPQHLSTRPTWQQMACEASAAP